jgi:hypothetical protein
MKPLSDDDLILHYYGEAANGDEIARALAETPELRARYQELRAVLDAIPELEIPETASDYSTRLWRQLQPQLEQQPQRKPWLGWFGWNPGPRWALAAAAMLLVVVSFLAGRFSSGPPPEVVTADAGQRILLLTVASHLERSELLLLELANAGSTNPDDPDVEAGTGLDVSVERLLAKELSGANRLYRQAAQKAGEQRVASVLDELERLLVEVANSPDQFDSDRLEELQQRLEDADILFKIRVVGSRLEQRADSQSDNSQST